jgi:sirohydrochlorin ferrochelatase
MTAPSLILVGYGSDDPRVAQVSHDIRAGVLAIRPELDVHVAFVGEGQPTGLQVATKLAKRGTEEAVIVPLLLSDAFHAHAEFPAMVAQIGAGTAGMKVTASRPVGPEAQLLSVVDRRLRDALRARRVSELDGLVFAAVGSTDVRSNAIVTRRARQWATHHRLPCVTAFGAVSGPTAAEAVRTLRSQGRRHVAVGSWFLSPTPLFVREATSALAAGAIAVSDPLGAGPELAEVVLSRYVVAAMELVDLESDEVAASEDVPVRHLSVVSA